MTVEGFKFFQDAEGFSAFDINAFLMSQSVTRFDNSTDRDTALSSVLTAGMISYDKATGKLQIYDGSSWIDVATGTLTADHGALTGLADDDHPQYHNDARGDVRYYTQSQVDTSLAGYLPLSGGTMTGNINIASGNSANAYAGGSNYWRPQDVYGNSYFDINNGQFYVDSDTYYFRNRASTNSLVIDSSGNGTFTGNVTGQAFYASNWFRTYGEEGLYSQSYGQHFYPDSGGFYWDIDGPLRVRSGYEGGIQGYLGYHDSNGFGLLHSGGSWWLNTPNNQKYLVIGGSQARNAYNHEPGIKLMFGGGDADAQGNYYIGTNLENYGGNYTKLDLRWHTGIRMGAQATYGGIRFYSNEDLTTEIFSIGKGDVNVRVNNTLFVTSVVEANEFAGDNGSTSDPSFMFKSDRDLGLYRQGTNSLGFAPYGAYLNSAGFYLPSGDWFRTSGSTGLYNQTYGGGIYMADSEYVRVYNNKAFWIDRQAGTAWNDSTLLLDTANGTASIAFHTGGVAPQFRVGHNYSAVYLRNSVDSGWSTLIGIVSNQSSRKDKQDIADFRNVPSSLSSDADAEYARYGLDLVKQLRPVSYRWKRDGHLDQIPLSERRANALMKLQRIRKNAGMEPFINDEFYHLCGRDCDGSEEEPCVRVRDWQNGSFGFIAEEVGEVAPELGTLDSEGNFSSIDNVGLTAVAIAAIQELSAKVEALEAQLQGA